MKGLFRSLVGTPLMLARGMPARKGFSTGCWLINTALLGDSARSKAPLLGAMPLNVTLHKLSPVSKLHGPIDPSRAKTKP